MAVIKHQGYRLESSAAIRRFSGSNILLCNEPGVPQGWWSTTRVIGSNYQRRFAAYFLGALILFSLAFRVSRSFSVRVTPTMPTMPDIRRMVKEPTIWSISGVREKVPP